MLLEPVTSQGLVPHRSQNSPDIISVSEMQEPRILCASSQGYSKRFLHGVFLHTELFLAIQGLAERQWTK